VAVTTVIKTLEEHRRQSKLQPDEQERHPREPGPTNLIFARRHSTTRAPRLTDGDAPQPSTLSRARSFWDPPERAEQLAARPGRLRPGLPPVACNQDGSFAASAGIGYGSAMSAELQTIETRVPAPALDPAAVRHASIGSW